MSSGFCVRGGKWYKHQLRLARDIYKQVIHQLFFEGAETTDFFEIFRKIVP